MFLFSLWLFWTAPSDNVGVTAYDMRYATDSVTLVGWTGAIQLTGEPTPSGPGATDSMFIPGLAEGVPYWFAIRSRDAAGNVSPLSNIVKKLSPDVTPPAPVVDLRDAR